MNAAADNWYQGVEIAIDKAKKKIMEEEVTEISRSIASQTPDHTVCDCPFCPMA